MAAFLLAERYAKADAILPLYLFRNRTFSVGAAANTVIGLGMFGGLATLPLYLQIVKGQSPTEAGLTLIPFTLGIMTGSIVAGQTTSRTGRYKAFPVIGTVLMGLGALFFSRLQADTTLPFVFAVSILFGLGLGFTMQPLVLAVQNAVQVRDMGVATSSSLFFRQMGGTLGTAVFLSVLFSTVGPNIAAAFRTASATPEFQAAVADPAVVADPANAPVLGMLQGGGAVPSLDDSSFINNLDPRLAQPFLDGFAQSVDTVLLLAAFIMVFGVILTVMLPELPLRNVSGIQGRFDDDAACAGTTSRRPRPRSAGSRPSSPTRPPWTARRATTSSTLERAPWNWCRTRGEPRRARHRDTGVSPTRSDPEVPMSATAQSTPHTCDGCLDRREVLVRAGLVTMGVAAAGVLAACGGSRHPDRRGARGERRRRAGAGVRHPRGRRDLRQGRRRQADHPGAARGGHRGRAVGGLHAPAVHGRAGRRRAEVPVPRLGLRPDRRQRLRPGAVAAARRSTCTSATAPSWPGRPER